MPPGRREMSLRSSASSAATEIFVAFAIWRSETPRRSRASRSAPPKPLDVRSAAMEGRDNRAYVSSPSRSPQHPVKPGPRPLHDAVERNRAADRLQGAPVDGAGRDKQTNGREPHRAGSGNKVDAIFDDPAESAHQCIRSTDSGPVAVGGGGRT